MTWTYLPTLLTDKDRVRFLVGDTDTTDQLVQDEEINATLTTYGVLQLAAAVICEHLSALYARQVDKRIGSLSVSASQRAKAFATRAAELRVELTTLAEAFVGGLSISDKVTMADDTDAVQPAFRVGQDDNPRRGPTDPYFLPWRSS